MQLFSKLSTRYGNEISEPSETDRRYAIADLFNEAGLLIADAYERNATTWFAVAHVIEGEKSFCGIELHREGRALLQSWAYSSARPEFEYGTRVTEADALFLWEALSRIKIGVVLAWFLTHDDP